MMSVMLLMIDQNPLLHHLAGMPIDEATACSHSLIYIAYICLHLYSSWGVGEHTSWNLKLAPFPGRSQQPCREQCFRAGQP